MTHARNGPAVLLTLGALLGLVALAALVNLPVDALRDQQRLMLDAVMVESEVREHFLGGWPRLAPGPGDAAPAYRRVLAALAAQPAGLDLREREARAPALTEDRDQALAAGRFTPFQDLTDLLASRRWLSGTRPLRDALLYSAAQPVAGLLDWQRLGLQLAADLRATGLLDLMRAAYELDEAVAAGLVPLLRTRVLCRDDLEALSRQLQAQRVALPHPARIGRQQAVLARALVMAQAAIVPFQDVAEAWRLEHPLEPPGARSALAALQSYEEQLTLLLRSGPEEDALARYGSWREVLGRACPPALPATVDAEACRAWFHAPGPVFLLEVEALLACHHAGEESYPAQLDELLRSMVTDATATEACRAALRYQVEGAGQSYRLDAPVEQLFPAAYAAARARWRQQHRLAPP